MPASRWQTNPAELFNWIDENDAELLDMLMPSLLTQLPPLTGNGEPAAPEPAPIDETPAPPEIVPILPLRGVVVFPQTAVPLTIGQPRSIKLVDDVVAGDRLVGLVAAINPELETPGPEDLYMVGTIATVHRLLRAPDGTIRLLVQGLERIRILEFTQTEPYLMARIERNPETVETGLEIDALARNARDQFSTIAELIPPSRANWSARLPSSKTRSRPSIRLSTSSASTWPTPKTCSNSIRPPKNCANWSASWCARPKCSSWGKKSRTRPAPRLIKSSANISCASS